MWSAILWPLAVVSFVGILFAAALFLVRLAMRDHLLEERGVVEEPLPALNAEVAHEPAAE